MENQPNQNRLLSHSFLSESIKDSVAKIAERIKISGDKPYVTVTQQLDLLNQLMQFDFGRYLIQNQGINGYWTHYMLTHPWFGRKSGKNNRGESFSALEDFLLNRAPTVIATQERFEIFLQENQEQVCNNAELACIPCGMMGELLYLNYDGIEKIKLFGIDYDPETLKNAKCLADERKLFSFVELQEYDAWSLPFENKFDLISSNGLNIYEFDNNKVIDLYKQFYKALKPAGKLVTSFLTFPPTLTDQCEWDLSKIKSDDALMQKIIFVDILDAKFQCYRSSSQTYDQLSAAGFKNITFIYDKAKIFPTVIATPDCQT